MGKSADRLGKELEAGINASPDVGGGIIQKATHVPHLNKIVVDTKHVGRNAVLRRNHELQKTRQSFAKRDPNSLASDMMFSIPVDDWEALMKQYPNYMNYDREQKRVFWNKQRQLHPEWFIA